MILLICGQIGLDQFSTVVVLPGINHQNDDLMIHEVYLKAFVGVQGT